MFTETTRPNMSPDRLEGESYEEFKTRQKLIKKVVTRYLKRGELAFMSSMIVPQLDGQGKIMLDDKGNPLLTNKVTRGRTYIKPKENEEKDNNNQ
jgi:hypothetical protein